MALIGDTFKTKIIKKKTIINALRRSRENINPFTTFNHRVENVIKQLVHTSAVRSSTQEARVARGEASYASFVLSKLPCFGSASYLHERTLMYEPIDNNGNWTEWSAIWAEIVRVISKSNELAVRVQFEITSMIADQICTTRSSITTLLHPFWNRPNFIDVVVSWFEVKFKESDSIRAKVFV